MLVSYGKEMSGMEEFRKEIAPALPALPKLKRMPLLENAVAFAVLAGGGWAALWIMELLFRLAGVA